MSRLLVQRPQLLLELARGKGHLHHDARDTRHRGGGAKQKVGGCKGRMNKGGVMQAASATVPWRHAGCHTHYVSGRATAVVVRVGAAAHGRVPRHDGVLLGPLLAPASTGSSLGTLFINCVRV